MQVVPFVYPVRAVDDVYPVPAMPERWLTWQAWQAEQSDRIFAEARMARKLSGNTVEQSWPAKVTPFQFAYFDDLCKLPSTSEPELIERARERGILAECASAFWKATHSQARSTSQSNEREETP